MSRLLESVEETKGKGLVGKTFDGEEVLLSFEGENPKLIMFRGIRNGLTDLTDIHMCYDWICKMFSNNLFAPLGDNYIKIGEIKTEQKEDESIVIVSYNEFRKRKLYSPFRSLDEDDYTNRL